MKGKEEEACEKDAKAKHKAASADAKAERKTASSGK
jgi:hypothetical protein